MRKNEYHYSETQESGSGGVGSQTSGEPDGEATERDRSASNHDPLGQREGKTGCVYFIETEGKEYIKIGYSRTPIKRIAQLGTLMPGLRLLGYIPGHSGTEVWLHEKFASIRHQGEWFKRTEELALFISSLGVIEVAPPVVVIQEERASSVRVTTKKTEEDRMTEHLRRDTLREHLTKIGALGGKKRAKPTACERCGKILPTARAAWVHCRTPRAKRAKQASKT